MVSQEQRTKTVREHSLREHHEGASARSSSQATRLVTCGSGQDRDDAHVSTGFQHPTNAIFDSEYPRTGRETGRRKGHKPLENGALSDPA